MKKETKLWILIAAVAAAVAAAVTIIVLIANARKKAEELLEPIYDCGCCDEDECACTCEEAPVEAEETIDEAAE